MSDYFIPLGGGNEIGASAYYLSIEGIHILLDCGARLKGDALYPDYERLLYELNDYSDLDLILVSHAHYDHIGSIARIASLAPNAEIITTEASKKLIHTQLLEFGRLSGRKENDKVRNERYRMAQILMDRIHTKPVTKPFLIRGCEITLLPAGHMPGAVMIHLKTSHHDILYTGDFSMDSMSEVNKMYVPEQLHPKTLLINVPNSYQEKCVWGKMLSENIRTDARRSYVALKNTIEKLLECGKGIYLVSRSIPKHLDMLYFLKSVFPETPVYLEPKSQLVAEILSDMGYGVYTPNIHMNEKIPVQNCIVIGQEQNRKGCIPVPFDQYSLHASILETVTFIRRLMPDSMYVLHADYVKEKIPLAYAARELFPAVNAVQAENGEKYYLKRTEKMKHDEIYRSVMENEVKIAEGQLTEHRKGRYKSSYEWFAVYGSLMYPGLHPHDAYDRIKNSSDISYEDYCTALHDTNLDNENRRRYVLGLIENQVTVFKKALDGDTKAVLQFSEFTENLNMRDRQNGRLYFIGKYMVIFMIMVDPDLKNDSYLPIAYSFGARYCDKLLRDLRKLLLKNSGVKRKRKSAKDVLQETENVLFESAKAEGMASGDKYEQLQFKYNNCKNSLELVQAMLDELNETIDETASEAKDAAIASFYINMNSEVYGHLMDSIELVDRRLAALKERKVKIDPQILPLTIVFKQLLRFIKDSGIKSIDTTGRVFTAEAEDLAEYTYIGEPFSYAGEKKIVIVERPGWKYENTIISLPTVREKEE